MISGIINISLREIEISNLHLFSGYIVEESNKMIITTDYDFEQYVAQEVAAQNQYIDSKFDEIDLDLSQDHLQIAYRMSLHGYVGGDY